MEPDQGEQEQGTGTVKTRNGSLYRNLNLFSTCCSSKFQMTYSPQVRQHIMLLMILHVTQVNKQAEFWKMGALLDDLF